MLPNIKGFSYIFFYIGFILVVGSFYFDYVYYPNQVEKYENVLDEWYLTYSPNNLKEAGYSEEEISGIRNAISDKKRKKYSEIVDLQKRDTLDPFLLGLITMAIAMFFIINEEASKAELKKLEKIKLEKEIEKLDREIQNMNTKHIED